MYDGMGDRLTRQLN
jgi:phenylalanyl-tRNA synthetase alpha chain